MQDVKTAPNKDNYTADTIIINEKQVREPREVYNMSSRFDQGQGSDAHNQVGTSNGE